jgi:hypothetical protein
MQRLAIVFCLKPFGGDDGIFLTFGGAGPIPVRALLRSGVVPVSENRVRIVDRQGPDLASRTLAVLR